MSAMLTFAAIGPGPVYTGLQIWLPLMLHEQVQRGGSVIENKTFIDCQLHGPAVIIPVSGCSFDNCDMGAADGDMRNLMFQPLGPTKITGAIQFRDCRFERCRLLAVGYTGGAEFLAELRAIDGATQ